MTIPISVTACQVLSFVSAVLQIPVLVWHGKQRNVAVICLIAWIVPLNLNTFVSTLVWQSDDVSAWWSGEGYGDIFVLILNASDSGLLCATLAIARGLAIILSANGPTIDPKSFKRRMIDLAICMSWPIIQMATTILVMTHRYALAQYQGPKVRLATMWPTIPLSLMPPFVICTIAVFYSLLALYRYMRKRADFKDLLHTTNSGLSASKFIRFLVFVLIITLVMFPLTLYYFIRNIMKADWSHHFSWSTKQANYLHVPRELHSSVSIDQIMYICIGFIQFASFGTGRELVSLYGKVISVFGLAKRRESFRQRRLRLRHHKAASVSTEEVALPMYTDQCYHHRYNYQPPKSSPSEFDDFSIKMMTTLATEHDNDHDHDHDQLDHDHDHDRLNRIIHGASAPNK